MDAQDLRVIALVAVGGALGTLARYAVSGWLAGPEFPWGTFVVNLSGTFLLSLIYFAAAGRGLLSSEARNFLYVGVFGGYTTFSTFGLETVRLAQGGAGSWALANLVLNAGVCLLGAFAGALLGAWLGGG